MLDKILHHAALQGITQTGLEVRTGLPKDRITRWKDGKGEPSAKQALRIADALNLPLRYLIDDAMTDPNAAHGLTPEKEYILAMASDLGFELAKARLLQKVTIESVPGYSKTVGELKEEQKRAEANRPKLKATSE